MSCSLCWQLMRANAWMAAQELNQLINAVPERIYQCSDNREIPRFRISSNGTEYLARTTSAPAFQILEIMPATAPRADRARADAGEAVGCADLAPTNLAALTWKIKLPPPPVAIQQHVQPERRRKSGHWPNHTDFVSGRFLAEKTHLVGYWNLRILRKDQVRNR
jgi:hypothetical protein